MSKKVLIIDDEKLARDRIVRFISDLNFGFNVIQAASGVEGLIKIKTEKPDLLLLDIEMPELNGMEMLQQIEDRPFRVIFQTAYDEYAIQAFKQNACDYLLKPFDKTRFKEAIERALADIENSQKLEELESQLRERDGYLQRISIKQGEKIKIINLGDVHCFVSRDHYTCVYTSDSEYISEVSLTHLQKRLDPKKFIRCHRNNIVCMEQIKSIGVGENMTVKLLNGVELPVSRGNRAKLKSLYAC